MNVRKCMVLISCLASSTNSFARTCTVRTTADEGKGSLRSAITKINACYDEKNTILFDIPATDPGYNPTTKSWCISVESELPHITSPVHINGYSQKGSRPNCNPMNRGHSGHIAIELCGPGAGEPCKAREGIKGLAFKAGSDRSCVAGLAVHNFPVGIDVCACHVKVAGNFLGIKADGETPAPNIVSVMVNPTAANTQVGTGEPADRNVIAGTGYVPETNTPEDIVAAVTVAGPSTSVQGSTVNLTSEGVAAVQAPSAVAIVALPTANTTIGGTTASQTVVVAPTQVSTVVVVAAVQAQPTSVSVSNVLSGINVAGAPVIEPITTNFSSGLSVLLAGSIPVLAPGVEAQSTAISIDSSVFALAGNGIVIGHPDDQGPISGVSLSHVKVGTDRLGAVPLPNQGHGIWLRNATGTQIDNVQTKYNGMCGICQEMNSTNTNVTGIDTSYNYEGGIKLHGPERASDEFEGTLINTRVKGNGNNAISSVHGYLKLMPKQN